jgi:ubiquinone/menaquinone biosynthesis C-methylase UbiE
MKMRAEAPESKDHEKNAAPGINKQFLSPDLDIDQWEEIFEGESREIFTVRHEIVAASGIKPGMRIADIGAGTGLYTRLFAEETGKKGWVFAVDIATPFLEHINERSAGQPNVTAVLGQEDSIRLPPRSIDLAFLCDTYHHLEYPKSTMRSIHQALKKGGTLVVVDFERIPGTSRDWVIGHMRAGKKVFVEEIEASGFEFVEEVEIPGLEENYFLRFRKR